MTSDKYTNQRSRMVENQLRKRGIEDERVLEAFESVPRHKFVNPKHRTLSYEDRALPTTEGQTISQPYMVAVMTEALEVEPDQKVLEIGTGSGYQTAILREMGARVYTVETVEDLSRRARETLEEIGYEEGIHYRVGDGSKGWPENAPYERILVTAAAPELPSALQRQAASSARIVLPIGSREKQTLTIYERKNGGEWSTIQSTSCVFVPLTGDQGWTEKPES